ncbi:MAG: hypothetical protein MK097_19175, partial [Dechloromonas sp.]|nr:hypothetical protein [Dechloromonas sp.]
MSGSTERLATTNPAASGRIDATVTRARQLAIQAEMGQAADELVKRHLGRAARRQQQAVRNLQELLHRLRGDDPAAARTRIARMREVENQLSRLRSRIAELRQAQLAEQSVSLESKQSKRLRRERLSLAEQTESLVELIGKLRIPAAANAAGQAAAALWREPARAPETAWAAERLEAAQRDLANQRRREQLAMVRVEMDRIDVLVNDYAVRQEKVVDELIRLEQLRDSSGNFAADQQAGAAKLGEQQATLRAEVFALAEGLESLPVFVHAIRAAGRHMQQVSRLLRKYATGGEAQQAAREAVQQLRQLAVVVNHGKHNLAARSSQTGGKGAGGQPGTAGQDRDPVQVEAIEILLGQAKLLKSMQLALQEQTQVLELKLAEGA